MALPATFAAPATRGDLLDAVRSAELVVAAQFPRLESAAANATSAADAARKLVTAGYLTRFQSDRLLAGRTDGFHLGPYVILEQVGRGVMGRVYKARHRTMNRCVAIKVLASEWTRTAAARQALQNAVRAAAKLNHANIAVAYDANEIEGRFYLVHEFVDGPNFETLVQERGPLPAADACNLIRQTALGLAHAHAQGMLHTNLKPANLLVVRATRGNPELVVKIADFGVSRSIGPIRGAGVSDSETILVGDPDFIAPERAHNPQLADRRADLYSLGAIFHFLLTGHPLFPGGSAEDKVKRHIWSEPPRLEHDRADIHPAVNALVYQLLAKHPQSRPQSAEEVVERLSAGFGTANGCINFDLPAPNVGPYSFVASPLSGGYHAIAEHSGRHPAPATGPYPIAIPAVSTVSPWQEIAEVRDDSQPSPTQSRRGRSLLPSWGMSGFLAGMLLASVAAIGVLVKFVGK